MAMLLNVLQLRQICDDVARLEEVGLHVTEMMSAGHLVKLKIVEDQRDGRTYQVIGIYTPESHPKPMVLRA